MEVALYARRKSRVAARRMSNGFRSGVEVDWPMCSFDHDHLNDQGIEFDGGQPLTRTTG